MDTKLRPAWLRQIDQLLEDEAVIDVLADALAQRWPESRRRGRPGTPVEVVLRMLVLTHLFDWSYDDLEHEVRATLVYRAFTRIDAGAVPDAKTILKIARALGPDVIEQIHRQVVGVAHGRRFRIDTTVVETPEHDPTDSTLLQDGVRVVTRTLQQGCEALGAPAAHVRNRLRSVGRRVIAIRLQSRRDADRPALVRSYRGLMGTTRAVLREAATMVRPSALPRGACAARAAPAAPVTRLRHTPPAPVGVAGGRDWRARRPRRGGRCSSPARDSAPS